MFWQIKSYGRGPTFGRSGFYPGLERLLSLEAPSVFAGGLKISTTVAGRWKFYVPAVPFDGLPATGENKK
jgi:hypothetical protein